MLQRSLLSPFLVAVYLLCLSSTVNSAEQCSAVSKSCNDLQALFTNIPLEYPALKQVLAEPEKYRVQIIYTPVTFTADRQPQLAEYYYRVDNDRYFYPASTVKLLVSLLALEWLYEQNLPDLNKDTIMLTDAIRPEQTTAHQDITAASGLPSVAHYIKKVLLVSDNDGYNRLYELMGQDYINQKLQEKGLTSSLINHRLSVPFTDEQNRHVNPVRFVGKDGKLIKAVLAKSSSGWHRNSPKPLLGKAYYSQGKLIEQPMDFSLKNKLALPDLDGIVKRVIFPQLYPETQRFMLTTEDREFVLTYMSMLPPQSDYPAYDPIDYPENYAKYLMFGGEARKLPEFIRIYNKMGSAYGHVLDGAYIIDQHNKIAFFLSAIIYTNENEVLNDDTYQTEEIGLPFMQQLGEFLYWHQLTKQILAPEIR